MSGSTLYCGENCNHTGPHRYPPKDGSNTFEYSGLSEPELVYVYKARLTALEAVERAAGETFGPGGPFLATSYGIQYRTANGIAQTMPARPEQIARALRAALDAARPSEEQDCTCQVGRNPNNPHIYGCPKAVRR